MGNEESALPGDSTADARLIERLGALAGYAELRNRRILGDERPGDQRRCAALGAILEQTGGIPEELRWPAPPG
jgi:hypothetical protein